MNKDALFSDGTSSYVIPAEPKENEKVRIRFRTAKDDVDEVRISTKIDGEQKSILMEKSVSGDVFDYYEIEWQLSDEPFSYCFEIRKGEEFFLHT